MRATGRACAAPSTKPLLDKLGVKPSLCVGVVGLREAGFLRRLLRRGVRLSVGRVRRPANLIFLAAASKAALRRLRRLSMSLERDGALWVVFPRGQQHIRETDVIAAARLAKLVDVKVVRFSATHTALKLVIPLARR